ncbi:hypothetical protein OIU76_029987 [Salix suchowensis]|nr:hypothetical protein OIU76_029987 [Salix suchowensis]
MSTLPVWIKLPNLPLSCWSGICLSKIASVIGNPIQCDMLTSSMTRLSYARVLVEIDLRKNLRDYVKVCLPNGEVIEQQIIYETLPKFCSHCNVIGHLVETCSKFAKKNNTSAATVVGGQVSVPKGVGVKDVLPTENDNAEGKWETVKKKHRSNWRPKKTIPENVRGVTGMAASGVAAKVGCAVRHPGAVKGAAGAPSGAVKGAPVRKRVPWGAGGLNSPLKQHEIVNLMKKKNIDVCGLLENKMSSSKVEAMQKLRLKKWKFLTNADMSSSARIVVFWNPSTVMVDLVDCSSQGSWSIPLWSSLHQSAHVHFGNQGAFSDHSFATARINPQDKGQRSFKFLNMWSSHVDFSSTASGGMEHGGLWVSLCILCARGLSR